MVEQWELDWNSSMIKYGEDAGTLEYILAKGGNLSDVNYVMLDQQDSGWEPIIKAIAERDNSHPDIIRKNVQQPYGVDANYRPAVPMDVGGVQVAAQNKGQARQVLGAQRVNQANQNIQAAQAAGQAPRGRDYAQTGQKLRGLIQGAKNIGREVLSPAYYGATNAMGAGIDRAGPAMAGAGKKVGGAVAGAGRYLAEKFPGVKERMGNFVQGVGDVARYGREGLRGAMDQSSANRQNKSRRSALEGAMGRMDTEMDNINRRYPENSPISIESRRNAIQDLTRRYGKNFNINPEEGQNVQEAMRAEMNTIGEDLQKPNKSAIERARDIGRGKRETVRIQDELGALGLGQQTQAQQNVALPEETAAAVEEQMTEASPEATDSSMTDAKPEEPTLEGMAPTTKEPEAPSPVPTAAPAAEEPTLEGMAPTTADNNSTTGTFTGQDMAPMSRADALKYYDEKIAGQYGAEGAGQEYGSKDRRSQMARIHSGEEQLTPTSFPGRGQGLAASNMLQSLGVEMVQLGHAEDQQEAEEIIEDAQQGDAEASKKVQDTQNKVPAKPAQRIRLSEDRLDSQWDALLKRLEVR